MRLEYASDISTPGLIYKPGDSIETPRRFHPEGYFFIMAFGPVVGYGNLYGIPSDLLQYLQSIGTNADEYWTNTATGNELNPNDKTVGYYTMSRMVCELRLSQVEQCYIYWDYSVTLTLDRKKGIG